MSLTGKKFTVPRVAALRRLVNETRATTERGYESCGCQDREEPEML